MHIPAHLHENKDTEATYRVTWSLQVLLEMVTGSYQPCKNCNAVFAVQNRAAYGREQQARESCRRAVSARLTRLFLQATRGAGSTCAGGWQSREQPLSPSSLGEEALVSNASVNGT